MVGAPEDISGLPDLSGLPHWAQWIAYVVLAVSLGIVGFVARYGWMMGQRKEGSSKGAEVAAVIVDPEALNRATDAVLALNASVERAADLLGQFIADSREERREQEIEDAREQGRVEGRAERRPPRQRRMQRPSKSGG